MKIARNLMILFIFLGIFMVFLPLVTSALTDDLQAYYKMDGTSGPIVDSAGGHNGENDGADRGVAGIINNSFDFVQANTDNATIPSFHELNSSIFTYSLWVNTDIQTNGQRFLDRGQEIQVILDNHNGLAVFVDAAGGALQIDTGLANFIGKWTHLAFTYSNVTGNLSMYVNGEINNSAVSSGNIAEGGALVLGHYAPAARYWDGQLDEIGFWDRVLDADEIASLYNGGTGISFPFGDLETTLVSPGDGSISSASNITFSANHRAESYNLTNATYNVWYINGSIFNQTTVSVNGTLNSTNLTIVGFDSGDYIWNVESCAVNGTGTLCGFALNNLSFSWRPFTIISHEYNNVTYDTEYETYSTTIETISTVPLITATLFYDGESFFSTRSDVGNIFTFKSAVSIPIVTSQETKNFYWEFTVGDEEGGTLVTNSTIQNQIVNVSNISQCGPEVRAVNYTIYKESDQLLLASEFDANFEWRLNQSSTVSKNSSFNLSGQSNYQFCINTNRTFFTDVNIELDSTGYTQRLFQFNQEEFTNDTILRELYLLNSSAGRDVELKLFDIGITPVPDHTIRVFRKLPSGMEIMVENDITDDFGKIVARMVENEVKYRIEFYDPDNNLVKVTSTLIVVCESTVGTCEQPFILQDLTGAFDDFDTLANYQSALTFNNNTNTFNFAWTDNRGEGQIHRLSIERFTFANGTEIVFDSNSSVNSGVLSYTIDDSLANYRASAFRIVDGKERRIDTLTIDTRNFSDTFGFEGLYWSFVLFMLMLLIGRFHPPTGVILYLFSVFMLGIFDIVYINPAILIAELIIGGIFIWAFRA